MIDDFLSAKTTRRSKQIHIEISKWWLAPKAGQLNRQTKSIDLVWFDFFII